MNNTKTINPEADFSVAALMDMRQLHFVIEQFYYHEAALLDDRMFAEWINLFSDDTRYWMPIRRTVLKRDHAREFTELGDIAFFDDDKKMLSTRVNKLDQPSSWSEDPPSRTRHIISNIRILGQRDDTISVSSNFHLFRARYESEENNWFGRRDDILVRTDDSFKIKSRKIYLDQTVILATNISCLF